MTKWTKGPYTLKIEMGGPATGIDAEIAEATDCEPYNCSQAHILSPERKPYNPLVTLVWDDRNGNSEEMIATSHLFTAAPELYVALEQILLSCTDEDDLLKTSAGEAAGIDSAGKVVFKGSFLTFLTRAQAAMAKARGEK